ncbi:MAG: MFS transporter [Candidatus Diapherotrites archaeon]|nr:MFS transporter [Candidatus Diapherotrites archaeon]
MKPLKAVVLTTFTTMLGWNFGEKFLSFALSYGTSNPTEMAFKASMVIFVLYLVFAFSNLFSGRIVERYGCRKSAALGALLYSPFLFVLVFSRSFVLLLLVATLVGFGGSLFWLGVNSFLAKGFKMRGEATGFAQAGSLLGGSIAAVIGGLILFVYPANTAFAMLFLLGGIILIAASVVALSIPDDTKGAVVSLGRQLSFLRNKDLLGLSLVSLICSSFAGVTIPMIPLIVKSLPSVLGQSGKGLEVGLVVALLYFLGIFSTALSGKISDVKGRKVILYAILLAGSASALIIFASTNVWMLAFGVMLYGPFLWLVNVPIVAGIGDLFKRNQALALAVTTFSGALGVALGALISAFMVLVPAQDVLTSLKAPFLAIAVIFLLSLVVVRKISIK